MRLDRKLSLIAPTVVLVLVAVGMVYAATQLHVLANVSANWNDRSEFIAAVERGAKPLTEKQALSILRFSLAAEAQRTAAITASRDLLITLATAALVSCGVLAYGIRSVPREHWPRLGSAGRSRE